MEDPDNLVLVYLRRMDAKLDRALEEFAEVKHRQSETHRAVLSLRREQTSDAEAVAHLEANMDRLREDVDRIKRRLDISE